MQNEVEFPEERNEYEYSSERHGFSILNAKEKTDLVQRFVAEDDLGHIKIEQLKMFDYEVPQELRGYTVIPKYKIVNQIDGKPGEFDDMYISEEYHGGVHPLLLMPSEKVTKTKK